MAAMSDSEYAAALKKSPRLKGVHAGLVVAAGQGYKTEIQRWGVAEWLSASLQANETRLASLERQRSECQRSMQTLLAICDELGPEIWDA